MGKAEKLNPGEKSDCKITMYNNGFILNDGEFRDLKDANNSKFYKQI